MTQPRSKALVTLGITAQLVFARVAFAQAEPPAAAPPPPPGGPIVTLHADNPRAELQQELQLRWTNVCVAPCGDPVDSAGIYRIGGGTIRPSLEFRMPRPSGPVLIDTQTGSLVKHWVGFGLVLGGGLLAVSGVGFIAVAPDARDGAGNKTTAAKDTFRAVGIGELVSGVILAVVGVPLWMSNTSVEVR